MRLDHAHRIYRDPGDVNPGGGGAPAPAPAPAPQPTPQPSPPPAPSGPAPDSLIQLPDGRAVRVSDVPSLAMRAIPEDQAEDFRLFQRIRSGDTTALLEAARSLNGAPPAPDGGGVQPPAAPSAQSMEQVRALETKLAALEGTLASVAPRLAVVDQIENVRQEGICKAEGERVITNNAQFLPALAHLQKQQPGTAVSVGRQLRQAAADASRSLNRDLTNAELAQVQANVLRNAETNAMALASAFGWKPPEVSRAPSVMDNQPPRNPGQLMFDPSTGRYVSQDGREYQPDASGNLALIPNRIPSISTPGSSPSPDSGTVMNGRPLTRSDMVSKMTARMEALRAGTENS